MAKEGIGKIQIPSSMIKVKRSKSKKPLHDTVVLVVSELFLSVNAITLGKILKNDPDPKKQPSKSSLSSLEPPKEMFTNVLLARGVTKTALDNCE